MSVSEKSLLKLSEAMRDIKVCCDFICDSRNKTEEIFWAIWDLGHKLKDLEEYRIPDGPLTLNDPTRTSKCTQSEVQHWPESTDTLKFVQWNVHNWPEVYKFISDSVHSNMKHYAVSPEQIITIDTEGGYSLIIKPKNWIYKNDLGQLYCMTTPFGIL